MKSEKPMSEPVAKIYVGNLPPKCTEHDLEELCKQFGNVVRADIVKNFGFVIYENRKDAQKAIISLDGYLFQNEHLQVQIARSKLHVDDKDDNQCYECGQKGHWARECPKRMARGGRRGPADNEPDQYRDRGPPSRDSYYGRSPASGGYGDYGRVYEQKRPYEHAPASRGYDYDQPPSRRPPVKYPIPYRTRSRSPPPGRYDYPPPRSSDPYARDPYARDSYARDPYPKDPYARESYYSRDSYSRGDTRDTYARDPYPPRSDPYANYRTPSANYDSPYGSSQAKRYGQSPAPPSRAGPGRY